MAVRRLLDIATVSGAGGGGGRFQVVAGQAPQRTANFLKAFAERPWLSAPADKIATDIAATEWTLHAVRTGAGEASFRRYPRLTRAAPAVRRSIMRDLRVRGELMDIEAHPVLDLLCNHNLVHVGPQALRVVQLTTDLVGEGYELIERWPSGPLAGLPMNLWPLPPDWVTKIPGQSGDRMFHVQLPGSAPQPVSPDDMIWIRQADPANPYGRGVGTASSLGDELDIDEFAAKEVKTRLYNRARPDFLVMSDEIGTPSDARRLEARWMEKHGGFFRAGLPHFLNFEAKIHQLSSNFEEMEISKLRPQQRDTIIQRFGVPPEQLGIIENSNRATIHASDFIYADGCLVPRLELMRTSLQAQLVEEYDSRLILDYVSPVPEDGEFQKEVMAAAPHMFTRGEFKRLAGIEPTESDNVYFVPFNLVETKAEKTTKSVRPGKALPALPRGSFTDEDPDDVFWLAMTRIADRMEPKIRRHFLSALDALREAIAEASESISTAIRTGKIETIVNSIPWDSFEGWMLGLDTELSLERLLLESIEQTGTIAAAELATALEVDAAFDVADPLAVAAARERSAALVTSITESQRDAIRQLVARAQKEGKDAAPALINEISESVGLTDKQEARVARFRSELEEAGASEDQIAKRVARRRAAEARRRGVAIARTESIWSANRGQNEMWRQAAASGLLDASRAERFWITTPDERLCEICEPIPHIEQNQAVKLDGVFVLGPIGASIGVAAHPPAHPLCRCGTGLRIRTQDDKIIEISRFGVAIVRFGRAA